MNTKRTLMPLTLVAAALLLGACSTDSDGDDATSADAATSMDDSDSTDDSGGDGDTTDDSSGDGDGDSETDTTGDGDSAMLRVLHLGLDAPAVDIYLDDADVAAVPNLSFQEGTGYLEVPAGPHTVNIVAAGGDPSAPVASFETPALEAGVKYSGVAHNYLASLGLLALADDDTEIESGNIRLQVVHAAADVGEVDIWEISGTPIPLLENVPYGAAGVLDVPNSALEIGIDVNDDATPDVTFSVPALGADQMVNVFAVNEEGGAPVFLLAHLPDGSTARVDAN